MSIRILVIDDFIASAEMLALVMELKGFEVRKAYDGKSALEIVRTFVPDVVLCDLNMPVIQGDELCRLLKTDPRLSQTLFIAQTAAGTPEARKATMEAGFDYHLVKPLDVGLLSTIIAQHCLLAQGH